MSDETTPVLVGGGQFTWRSDPGASPSPTGLLKIAAERAALDAGLGTDALAGIDGLAMISFAIDAPGERRVIPHSSNPPLTLSRRLGASPAWNVYTRAGGNSSQYAINVAAQRIAEGRNRQVLVVGAEFLGSGVKRLTRGLGFDDWDDAEDLPPPEWIGDGRPGVSPYEVVHGMDRPINIYPLFENALRARDGRSIPDHQRRLGELFAPFTRVAVDNPEAWFPVERSAEELVTVTPANRMIGFPYPKFLNAIMDVDQSAGVLMTSLARARELGVAEDRLVFLHGCADANDIWNPIDRQDFHSSPAMRLTGERALEMAGIGIDDIAAFDLYSCFPSAVQVGAESLGLALDDPRGFTVTGGLPYAGGPGNNYAMHGVVAMMQKLRQAPGTFGLCTANGWYLTKQSTGIYSTRRPAAPFRREDPAVLQAQIDALPRPAVVERPSGRGKVETYTVIHDRDGFRMGIIVARDMADRRFAAIIPGSETEALASLEAREGVGRTGIVARSEDDRRNLFTLD
ncbi:MAG: acetyl-CoA acetyltransferase [Phenylobacterium sp.]